MFLPIGNKINNYTVASQIQKNKDYVLYTVTDEYGTIYYAAEFYPDGVCTRDMETSLVVVNPEFIDVYNEKLRLFKSGVENLKISNLMPLIKIVESINYGDSCFFIYKKPEGMPLATYLEQNEGKLSYKKAYELLAPLGDALHNMSRYNVYFTVELSNLYLNSYGNLEHSGFFVYNYTPNYSIEDIANVFYTLITGKKYTDLLQKPSDVGVALPARLDTILFNALYSNEDHGSIENFLREIKDSVLFDSQITMSPPTPKPADTPPPIYTSASPVPPTTVSSASAADSYVQSGSFDWQSKAPVEPSPPALPQQPFAPSEVTTDGVTSGGVTSGGYVGAPSGHIPPVTGGYPSMSYQPGQGQFTQGPGPQPIPNNQNPNAYTRPYAEQKNNSNRNLLLGCLGGGCLTIVVLAVLFVAFAGVIVQRIGEEFGGYSSSSSYNYNWDEPTESEEWYTEDEEIPFNRENYADMYMSYTFAFLSYDNPELALNNTVCSDGEYVYYRSYTETNGWCVIKESETNPEDKVVFLENVVPAFMAVNDSVLVYADYLNDYAIYVVDKGNPVGAPELLVNTRSAYVTLYNNTVFYTNLEDFSSLYSVELGGNNWPEKLNDYNCEYPVIIGSKIYYTNYEQSPTVYVYDITDGSDKQLSDTPVFTIIADNNLLYYVDFFTYDINAMDLEGNEVAVDLMFDANCMDVSGQNIYTVDYETTEVSRYNILSGESEPLGIYSIYFTIIGDQLYFYEYDYEYLHRYNLKTGEVEELYEGEPDFMVDSY